CSLPLLISLQHSGALRGAGASASPAGAAAGAPGRPAGGQPVGAACRSADAGPEHVAGGSNGERTWAAGGWAAGGRGLPECRYRVRACGVWCRLVQHGRLKCYLSTPYLSLLIP
ncbi:unnamed protein product, partial [Urochloa humidicola]